MVEVVLTRSLLIVVMAAGCHGSTPPAISDSDVAPRVCPKHLDFELIGSESRFDAGYTGFGHGIGPANGSKMSVEVTACDTECRRCQFHGLVDGPSTDPVKNQRCVNDTSVVCTSDAECPGTKGPCRFMFPPIPAAANAPTPTCTIAYFEPVASTPDTSALQGVIDLATGEADMTVMNIKVRTAIEQCDVCQGDTKPGDGVPEGHCVKTPTKTCDVHGVGIANPLLTSFDCSPSAGGITIPLPVSGTSTSGRAWTMDNTHPACAGKRCWCGVCSNDGTPCSSKADCAAGATCGATVGATTYTLGNNKCTTSCTWNATTQRGVCAGEPTKTCFPDTESIVALGEADVKDGYDIVQIANLLCMPPFGNALLDGGAGFPGMLFFQARFRVTERVE